MDDRFSDPTAFGKRIGIVLEPITRISPDRLTGAALARNNGRVAAECSVPMQRANFYRKGSKLHKEFIAGYEWATKS